jgi:hypothetical protein
MAKSSYKKLVAMGLVLASSAVHAQIISIETLTFDNNTLPNGWSLFGGHGNIQVINSRLEIGQVDNYGGITKAFDLSNATQVKIEYDANIANVYWGQGNQVLLVAGTTSNPLDLLTETSAYAGMKKSGYGENSIAFYNQYILGNINTNTYSNVAPPVFGNYHMSAIFEDGKISQTVRNLDTGATFSSGVTAAPGFLLSSMHNIALKGWTTTGDSAWFDNATITTLTTAGTSAPPATPSAFLFPIVGTEKVTLNTMAGGDSAISGTITICGGSTGYLDACHSKTQAYYSLDFDSTNAKVVAAQSGKIVSLKGGNGEGLGYKCATSTPDCIVIDHGNGFYTEYREFTANSINPKTGLPFKIDDVIDAGMELGTLTGKVNEHLHFQVLTQQNNVFNSQSTNATLANVTVGGRLIRDFKLAYNEAGNPIPTAIYGQQNPLLPTMDPNSQAAKFNIVVGNLGVGYTKNEPIYIDPLLAIGYDYQVYSGPKFSSVILPNIGDGQFELWLWNGVLGKYEFSQMLMHDMVFDFMDGGIDRFRILGIELSAGLDPNDPQAFVTGLTFSGSGNVEMAMTPLTAVPEPEIYAMLLAGLGLMGFAGRRRKVS